MLYAVAAACLHDVLVFHQSVFLQLEMIITRMEYDIHSRQGNVYTYHTDSLCDQFICLTWPAPDLFLHKEQAHIWLLRNTGMAQSRWYHLKTVRLRKNVHVTFFLCTPVVSQNCSIWWRLILEQLCLCWPWYVFTLSFIFSTAVSKFGCISFFDVHNFCESAIERIETSSSTYFTMYFSYMIALK